MPDERQAFTVRLTEDRYEWLRTQAFVNRISMQKIIEDAIDTLRRSRVIWVETEDGNTGN